MDDLIADFLTETFESLEVIDNELVRFEREPTNQQILDNVFRLVHTIKGTCGFLGLRRLEMLAHAAETPMGRYRDGAGVTDDGVSTIPKSIDLKSVEGRGTTVTIKIPLTLAIIPALIIDPNEERKRSGDATPRRRRTALRRWRKGARLEAFKLSDIERSGERDVVQYRGKPMPLLVFAEGERAADARDLAIAA